MYYVLNRKYILDMRKRNNKNRKGKKPSKIVVTRNSEIKFHDVTLAIPVATAVIYDLCAVPQGFGVNQRIGRDISVVNLQMKLTLTASTTLIGSTVSSVRFLVLQDLQQIEATTPAITDVINPANVTGLRNIYFTRRFKVLRDMVFKVDTYNPTINFSNIVKMDGVISYSSIGVCLKGLYVIWVGSNLVNPPNLSIGYRLNFRDF